MPNLKSIPIYSFVMTVAEFLAAVKSGSFVDYDGFGYWANDQQMDDEHKVYPSNAKSKSDQAPNWATKVVWFNK